MKLEEQIQNQIVMHKYKVIISVLTLLGDTYYEQVGIGKLYDQPLLKVILEKVEDQVKSHEEVDQETGVNKLARLIAGYAFDRYDEGHPDLLEALYATCYDCYTILCKRYGITLDNYFKSI